MPLLPVEDDVLGEVAYLPIHTHPYIAGLTGILEDVLVLALAVNYLGGHDHDAAISGQVEDGVHNLLDRLTLHRPTALVAVRAASAGI